MAGSSAPSVRLKYVEDIGSSGVVVSEVALRGKAGRPNIAGLRGELAEGLENCKVVQLESGLHYPQEDHPDVIGANVKAWLVHLGIGSSPKQMLTM
jgi:hypothetical protein